ncbi:hypothetical protein [Natronobeatus ordinarius]|uniref:hypothetical protein n=1 Tax=Natronobeatus ordinarius TaxID=2963433 RepID=UPI0020CF4940|nr:hypothetical protein [Natronobeatus ordinarius]
MTENMGNANSVEWVRRVELALAILILLFAVLFRTVDLSGVVLDNELLGAGLFFGVLFFLPLGLAIVSLLSAVLAKSTVRSYLAGAVATVALLGVLGSWTLYFLLGSGGIVVGHLLSVAFGVILAVVVLLTQATTVVGSYR